MNAVSSIFETIRDIPYRIALSSHERAASCSEKCIQLKQALTKEGMHTKRRVCSFIWSSLPLPEHVIKVPHNDGSLHVYLEVSYDGIQRMNIDPTRDKGLGKIFPIAQRNWHNNTLLAVPVIERRTDEQSSKIMESPNPDDIDHDLTINGAFYEALNTRLVSIRI